MFFKGSVLKVFDDVVEKLPTLGQLEDNGDGGRTLERPLVTNDVRVTLVPATENFFIWSNVLNPLIGRAHTPVFQVVQNVNLWFEQ